jgi:hypothetical protein
MSNYNYNPIPPRVWSRVQNPCTYTVPGSDYTEAFIPLTGQTVSQAQADYETKQIYKGNILQYKGNSARFTKSQRYSQLARMAGPNRTKVFATQSQTYTNPNTTGLLRVGFQTYPYPNQIVGAPNNISGPFQYNVQNPYDCSGNSVQDGGTLVCGTFANPCTGEIIKQGVNPATICNPASASDVPGTSILCWNNKVQTWFPRQRYFMNNSTDKWPVNYKGFVTAVTTSNFILNATFNNSNCGVTNLTWSVKFCYPLERFDIYVNNRLYTSVPSNTFTYEFDEQIGSYEIYIVAISNNKNFGISNLISIYIVKSGVIISINNTIKVDIYNNIESPPGSGDYYDGYVFLPKKPFNNGDYSGEVLFSNCNELTNVSILIVGGGGGGSSGYTRNSGGGGGSGGIIYATNASFPINTIFDITVGAGGKGRTPGGLGGGNSAGSAGTLSSLNVLNTTYIANSGGGGLGTGSTSVGGGKGGNISRNGFVIPFGIFHAYSGSGGGGGGLDDGNLSISGTAGTISGVFNSTTIGNNGTNGGLNNAGNGGLSVFMPIYIPILNQTIYIGGGAGGGYNKGGGAGYGTSGGQGNSSTSKAGEDAIAYGAGGGGGAYEFGINNTGGNGGSGVIMTWWKI